MKAHDIAGICPSPGILCSLGPDCFHVVSMWCIHEDFVQRDILCLSEQSLHVYTKGDIHLYQSCYQNIIIIIEFNSLV